LFNQHQNRAKWAAEAADSKMVATFKTKLQPVTSSRRDRTTDVFPLRCAD